MNTAPEELIAELDAGLREITFEGADMYIVYRTIRENPEGVQPTEKADGKA